MCYFANFLKQVRKELSLNKVQMAEKFSWTPMYYGRYENGKLLPTKQNVDKFVKVLNVDESTLLDLIKKDKESLKK